MPATTAVGATEASIWKDPSFLKYYLFNLFTYFGSGMSVVALPVFIYEQSASPIYTSLVVVFTGIPYLLLGLFAGAFADRGERKKIMVGCDLFCAVVLGSVPLAAIVTGEVAVAHLLAVALLTSTAFVWFDAASHGALLQLVGRRRLVAANSALISSSTAIQIGSPVIAGLIIYRFGPEWAIGIDAVCYFLAAAIILGIRGSFQSPRADHAYIGLTLLQQLARDIKEGIGYIWSEPLIRSLTLVGFGNGFVGGAVVGLIVVFGAEVLGFGKDAPQMSLLFTCGSLGALAASLALPLLRQRLKPGMITLAGLALNAFALLGVALNQLAIVVYAIYIFWQLGNTLVIVNGITLRQQLTPDHLQGRVHASGRMIAYGGTPIGSLLGGIAAAAMSVQLVYGLLAMAMLGIFLYALRTPLAR